MSFKTLTMSALLVVGTTLPAQASTFEFHGEVYSFDKETNTHEATGESCSVRISGLRRFLDTEHGSPRQVLEFDYQIEGIDRVASKYKHGKAHMPGWGPNTYLAQDVHDAGVLGAASLVGSRVDVIFNAVTMPIDDFLTAPSLKGVRLTWGNNMVDYFGGEGTKWSHKCIFPGGEDTAAY